MHVRYSSRLTWVVIASGFLWLAIMIGLTLSDVLTRNWSQLPGGR
jgi:caa(3)-type oxidase subunit IV